MKIDMHVHTKERSPCAHSSEEEMIEAGIEHGLDGLVITDHQRLVPGERLSALNARYAPFRVFGGIELRVQGEDILVLGVHDPTLEARTWGYPELYRWVDARGGALILAHPFRHRKEIRVDIETYPPHAIEVRSINTPAEEEDHIRGIAERMGLDLVCNSDAHRALDVGRYYTSFAQDPVDDQELAQSLRNGRRGT
jgi:predicted metal-dependent phosphoesterase TrpH